MHGDIGDFSFQNSKFSVLPSVFEKLGLELDNPAFVLVAWHTIAKI
jgi:hypothetical protein